MAGKNAFSRKLRICLGVFCFFPAIISAEIHAGHDHTIELSESNIDDKCSHARTAFSSFSKDLPEQMYSSAYATNTHDTDVLHYDINLAMTVAPVAAIQGDVSMNFTSSVDNLSEFFFRLHTAYTITKIELNGSEINFQRLQAPEVRAYWTVPLEAGATAKISIYYQGNVPTAEQNWFGGVKISNGMMYSYAQPWNTHHWLAVKEPPGDYQDKSTADLIYTVPSSLTVASNGVLLSQTNNSGGTKTFHWKTTYPTAPYLLAFSAAAYTKSTKNFSFDGKVMPVELYVLPGMSVPSGYASWDSYLQLNSMLQVFSEKFGTYPFIEEKYGIALWDTTTGGMEHQTISGQKKMDTNGVLFGGQALTAHELAHQWFGDSVTARTLNDIWLNEGFASYLEVLWEEFKPGSTGRPAYLSAMWQKYPSSSSASKLYVDNPTTASNTFGTAQYRKGAWVLHMLRALVGDEHFFEALREYLQRHAYSTAETADLQLVFEEITGKDLGYFFDQWVYQYGAPAFSYGIRQLTINNKKYIDVMIKQIQSASYIDFDVELPIRIRTSSGDKIVLVRSRANQQNFLIPIEGTYQSIAVDPENIILKSPSAPSSATYVAGGPKIIASSEELHYRGEVPPAEIQFDFSGAVSIPAGAVRVVGADTGEVAISTSYNSSVHRLTVTLPESLPPDSYEIIVSDLITDAAGKTLDGEVPGGIVGDMFPSGDGLPGGAFVFPFVIEGVNSCLIADIDGDGEVGFSDITQILALWGQPFTADPDGDGIMSFGDITIVLSCWG